MRESFKAIVFDNAPKLGNEIFTKGEVVVTCEPLFGDEVSDPIPPRFQYAGSGYGLFLVPPNGAHVDLEYDDTSDGEPDLEYVACVYDLTNPVPLEFGNAPYPYRRAMMAPPVLDGINRYPNRMGIKLPSLLAMVDITPGDEHVWFHHASGAGIEINKDGDMFLIGKQDLAIEITRNGVIQANGNMTIDFLNLFLGGPSAVEPVPLGTALVTAINNFISVIYGIHTHLVPGVQTGSGSTTTGTPNPSGSPIDPGAVLSQVAKVR